MFLGKHKASNALLLFRDMNLFLGAKILGRKYSVIIFKAHLTLTLSLYVLCKRALQASCNFILFSKRTLFLKITKIGQKFKLLP